MLSVPTTDAAIAILIPVFNDWECVRLLGAALGREMAGRRARLVLVDDGSTDAVPAGFGEAFSGFESVDIIHLQSNVGHQRAIAVGLYVIHRQMPCEAVVIMDGDGEDRAEDVPRLIAEFRRQGGSKVIFAARAKRMEGALFQVSYQLYRGVHWLLTGIAVRVGNFSVVPADAIGRLMVAPDLWNHYAAAVFRSRIAMATIPIARGSRLQGRSRMNFVGLAVHGLSAISVFSDIVATRLLFALLAGVLGWVAFAGAALTAVSIALAAQTMVLAALIVFLMIGSRSHMTFLPARDAGYFVASVRRVYESPLSNEGLNNLQRCLTTPISVTN